MMTFLSTVLLDIDLGLMVGLCTSLLALTVRSCLPQLLRQEEDKTVLQLIGPIHYLTAGGKNISQSVINHKVLLVSVKGM